MALKGPMGDKSGAKNVTNGPKRAVFFFLTPSGLFRQDSDRLGHGQNFFRALEGVPKYTKKAKCVGGLVKSHVHRALCTQDFESGLLIYLGVHF